LYLRKPTVTFEGNKWYNRIGSQMLRVVGLEELIAKSAEEYIRLTLKLIDDEQYRLSIQEKLKQADLNSTIFSSDSKNYFKKAIDFLIENHERLKHETSRKPIRIKY
jgi:predicted O-linked N-acetylglucosamine transferase (SPINDLY family)